MKNPNDFEIGSPRAKTTFTKLNPHKIHKMAGCFLVVATTRTRAAYLHLVLDDRSRLLGAPSDHRIAAIFDEAVNGFDQLVRSVKLRTVY